MRSIRLVPTVVTCLVLLTGAPVARARLAFHPGIEAGWQSSTLLYHDPMSIWDPGWANTFTGGLTLDVSFAHDIGIATGVRYVCYSNHVTFDNGETPIFRETGEFRLRANYVAVPVLVRFAPRHRVGPRIGLGTEVAFLTSARLSSERFFGFTDSGLTTYDDVRDNLQPVELSACATLGWAIPLERHAALAQVRVTRGLTDAARDADWYSNWRTAGIDGTLGVSW